MPKKTLPKTLNLLEPTHAPKSTWDKIYDWVFRAGRYVIVGIELVVILSFVSRFSLDVQNNDLKESMMAKAQMIDAQRETEHKIRKVQSSLKGISDLKEDQFLISADLDDVHSKIPSAIYVSSLSLSREGVRMRCKADSYDIIKKLEINFDEDPKFRDVDVSLSKGGDDDTEINFSLTAIYADALQD